MDRLQLIFPAANKYRARLSRRDSPLNLPKGRSLARARPIVPLFRYLPAAIFPGLSPQLSIRAHLPPASISSSPSPHGALFLPL